MDSSYINPEARGTLMDIYKHLWIVNRLLENIQVAILRASSIWVLYQKEGSDSSDRPEYWVDPKHEDIWSNRYRKDIWAQDARSKGLFDSKRALIKELKRLGEEKKGFENTQRNLRLSANRLSQPSLRSMHILDLPDEILARVFDFVEDSRPNIPSLWKIVSQDIKNSRLTCKDFYRVSSRQFLRSVCVDLSVSSLSRFEEISRHPIISKGVGVVRAVLHFYDPDLSDDFLEFVTYHADELGERLVSAKSAKWWKHSHLSDEAGLEMVRKGKVIIESWRRIASETREESLTEEDQAHSALLRTTHQKYQGLCSTQEELWKSGEFTRKVAAGIARMPCARILYLLDWERPLLTSAPLFDQDDITASIYEAMLQPMNYYSAYHNGFTPRLCDIVTKLPMAVKHSGAWLERIYIELSYLNRPSDLLLSPEDREQLSSAMQRLQKFSFSCTYWINEEEEDEPDEEILDEILTPYLNTASLQELDIDMMKESDEPSTTCNVSKLMTLEQWQNLSHLFLRHVAFHLSEFRRLVSRPRQPFNYLGLEGVRLLSGTWAEMLDILREKSVKIMRLRDPLGAECNEMTPDELSWGFGRGDIIARTEAELYVTKITHVNPLRK